MPKNAPKVRDAEVTRAFEHTYKDINELIMSVNGLSSKSNREGYKGKNGDMRLYRDLRTKQYFFEGRFDDGWAQVELDLAKKTNTTTVTTSGDTNVQSDWNVSDNTSDAFIKNKPTVQYTSAIPSMGSGNSYAAGLTPVGSGTHSDTYLRKDGTWATPIDTNTTYSVMASGNSYAAGLVPAGSGTHSNTFLRKDGTWVAPSSGIALTDLSASAPITYNNSSGAFSIADHAVALAKLPEIATARFLGRTSSSTGDVEVLTVGQVGTLLSLDQYLTAPRTVTAGGNTLATSETLAFTEGSNVTITESGGAVTIASTDTNTDTVDMGDGFRLVDVDSNVQVTENKYVKFKTASGGSGFGDITGGDGSSGNPWIYQLQYTDTNTTYSVMGSGNSYAAGLVLAGASSHGNTYLRKDGTWDLPSIYIQDDDGDSLTVDIDEHIKITGTGGITTDWTTDDAGGSGAPNILTIGVSNITNVGTVTSGVWNATAIASQYLDSDTAHLSGTQTFTGAKTFSAAATMYGLQINAGSGNDTSGQDATLYISATSDNDWGIKLSKASNNYGMMIDVAADAGYALRILGAGTQKFNVDGAGVITTATWNGAVIASAYLDADTAHLSGTQTFSGAKTFSSTTTFSNTSSYGDLDIIPTSSNVSIIKHDNGSGSLTLRGDQINLQNKDGDDTGLSYNDGGGVTFGSAATFNASPVFSTGATGTLANRDGFTDFIGYNASYGSYIGGGASNASRYVYAGGYFYDGSSVRTLIHSGNIGSQSVDNADKLDSYHGSNYIGKNGNTYYRPSTWINMVDGGNAGLYWSSGTGAGWHLYPKDTGAFYVRSGNSNYCQVELSANGTVRGMVYADSSNNVGLLNQAGGWALQKQSGGKMILHDNGGTTYLGSGDEWGRLEFNNYTNGTYVYLNQATFRVDADWNPYGNSVRDLGSDSLRWDNIYINTIAQVGQLKLNNNFKWEQGSSAYGRFSDWLEGGGTHGIYFPNTGMTTSPHFYPVGTGLSYGTYYCTSGQSSWHGIVMSSHSSRPTYMHDSSHGGGGLYYQPSGVWATYWDVGNACFGVGSSTTSSSYHLYAHGAIYSTGDIVAFSDARVKTNVLTIDNALDKVLNMRGVYYNPIDKETKEVDDRRRVGVIAQELNEVLPEAVTYAEDVDEYGVDYGKLTGVLIEAIKELKQEINELKGS